MPDDTGAFVRLADAARTLLLRALVVAFRRGITCAHDDVSGYTIVAGNRIHCKCGQSFKVKCMHTRVKRLLPKVWRCEDCCEYRGAGEVEGKYV